MVHKYSLLIPFKDIIILHKDHNVFEQQLHFGDVHLISLCLITFYGEKQDEPIGILHFSCFSLKASTLTQRY